MANASSVTVATRRQARKPSASPAGSARRAARLAERKIDIFYCPRFSNEMRNIAADAFIRRVLVHGLNARHIVVGDDFHFARRREGSVEDLLRVAPALDLTVEQYADLRAAQCARDQVLRHHKLRKSLPAVRAAQRVFDSAVSTILTQDQAAACDQYWTNLQQNLTGALAREENYGG